MNINELTNRQKREANDFANFYSYIQTEHSNAFLNADYEIIFVDKGNQAGGTAVVAYGYVLRILGWHPIPKKNMLYFKCKTALDREIILAQKNISEADCDMPVGHYFSPLTYFDK